MDKHLQQTQHFMEVMQQPVPKVPTLASKEDAVFRYTLLAEELKELKEGMRNEDLVEIADALCDLQVVLDGAFNKYGLAPIKEQLMDAVYHSNMTKTCTDATDAEASVALSKEDAYSVPTINGRYIIKRVSDNKVLKGVDFEKPDLKNIIDTFIRNQG